MEKLIGLLNEFCREKRGDYVVVKYREKEHSFDTFVEGKVDYMTDLYVVSKRCEFIKWLVDNDKIDLDYTYNLVKLEDKCYDKEGYYIESNYESYGAVDRTVMYLAISDNPIQDLISLLK